MHQGLILGPLDPDVKLFADDTLMFSVVNNPINTSQKMNEDLNKISLRSNKWKISFNLDRSKQVQEAIFSWKINKVYHPPLLFNNSTVEQISTQKHLGIHLDDTS